MSESAALVPAPKETACTSLVLFPWPHNPHLRRSLTAIEPEAENCRRIQSNSPGQIISTQYAYHRCTAEGNDLMTQTTNPDALKTEADDDLLTRYRDFDDPAAFAELDRRYHQELLLYARRHLPAALRADAEDMVQEGLLSFHKNRKEFAPENRG